MKKQRKKNGPFTPSPPLLYKGLYRGFTILLKYYQTRDAKVLSPMLSHNFYSRGETVGQSESRKDQLQPFSLKIVMFGFENESLTENIE